MQKKYVNYLMIGFLLLIYLNRGLFVFTYEAENSCTNNEINTVIEWVMKLVTGESNGIDEDGDLPGTQNIAQIIQPIINSGFTTVCPENFYMQIHKLFFIYDENIIVSGIYDTIEQPPDILS